MDLAEYGQLNIDAMHSLWELQGRPPNYDDPEFQSLVRSTNGILNALEKAALMLGQEATARIAMTIRWALTGEGALDVAADDFQTFLLLSREALAIGNRAVLSRQLDSLGLTWFCEPAPGFKRS